MTSEPLFIYGLTAEDGRVRYVGMSKQPDKRLKQHVREARARRGRNPHKESWIRGLLDNGIYPTVVILRQCCEETWVAAEKEEIIKHKASLTNIAEGGDRPPVMSSALASALAKRLQTHRDRPIHQAIRRMSIMAKHCESRNPLLAFKLRYACFLMRQSQGTVRDNMRAWAEEKFDVK
jgi:predicted GIY-YIG superfamily endonuclease